MSLFESVARQELLSVIEEIKSDKELLSLNEAEIKRSVILRILQTLGWDTFNVREVYAEFPIDNVKVDYALRDRSKNENKVFVEAKRGGEELAPHQEQLLTYSFKKSVGLAVLTNGRFWQFFLPMQTGDWHERIFDTIDLSQQTDRIVDQFIGYLLKEKVFSGEAENRAKDVFRSAYRLRKTKESLPLAWQRIASGPDKRLIAMVVAEVESMSGYRPEDQEVSEFIKSALQAPTSAGEPRSSTTIPPRPTGSGGAAIRPPSGPDGFTKGWGRVEFVGLDGSRREFGSPAEFAKTEGLKYLWMEHALDCALRPKNPADGTNLDREYTVKVGDVSLNRDMARGSVQSLKGTGKVTIRRIR